MGNIKDDINRSVDWLLNAFFALDIRLDFTPDSIKHIDNFLKKQTKDGKPKHNSLLSENFGGKIFAIASYVGEVIIRNTKNSKWITDDTNNKGELNSFIKSINGYQTNPVLVVMRLIQSKKEVNLFIYTKQAIERLNS